jgi:hypothetical protein
VLVVGMYSLIYHALTIFESQTVSALVHVVRVVA